METIRRPNILWIMTDQHHADCMSWRREWGSGREVRTPRIDSIVEGGVAFNQAFAQSGICTPSRISIATGLYVHQHGQYHNWGDVRDMPSIGAVLRDAGYQTASVGKQHFLPYWKSHGFDVVRPTDIVDTLDDPMDNAYWAHLARNGLERHHEHSMRYRSRRFETYESVLPAEHSVESVTADEALRFLEERDADRPFLLHLSFNRPHPPYAPPPEYLDRYDPERIALPSAEVDWDAKPSWQRETRQRMDGLHPFGLLDESALRRCLAYYYDLIELIDDQIGRVLDYLREAGLRDDTIVIFTSDHGEHAGDLGMMLKPLATHDSILRVPFIMQWPGRLPEGETRDRLVETVDLFPTLCDLLGLAPPETPGTSLLPILEHADSPGRDAVYSETRGLRTVRTREWKYGERRGGGQAELYDLATDPGETRNLTDTPEHGPQIAEMRSRLTQWLAATPPDIPRDSATDSPYDPDYPPHDGWRILTGDWWPASERV